MDTYTRAGISNGINYAQKGKQMLCSSQDKLYVPDS